MVEREVLEREEVRPLVLGARIGDVARAEISHAGARVGRFGPQVPRPHGVVPSRQTCGIGVHADLVLVAPRQGPPGAVGAVRIAVEVGPRAVRRLVSGCGGGRLSRGAVAPVVARMVHDHVEDDSHAEIVRRPGQRQQVVARAEAGIDVEEVLDAVPVIAVEPHPLLEHGTDPDGRHTEPCR
jgi:hypothetical protein